MSNRAQSRRASREGAHRPLAGRTIAILGTIIILASIIAIAVVNHNSVPTAASVAPPSSTLLVGETAPPFSVTTIEGKRFDSARVSKPIMLEVFATWCPHCQHETAEMNSMQRRYGEQLAIIAASGSNIASDRQSPENLSDVAAFSQHFAVVYPIAFDANLGVAKRYIQGGFPTIVFINSKKQITAIESGEIPIGTLIADAQKAGVPER